MHWNGKRVEDGMMVQVHINEGIIDQVIPIADNDLADVAVPWISAGWIDLQVNGFGGYDFNGDATYSEDVIGVTNQLHKKGVTAYLPTVITGSFQRIEQALAMIAQTCHSNETVAKSVLGIHLEGPYLAEQDGPRGAHDLQYICDPDEQQFLRWQEAANGNIRMVTLAPEKQGAAAFIANLVEQGIIVSLGHTQASSEQIERAVLSGATVSTHIGNGAHPILPRHPNYIWEQLAEDRLWGCFIADGHHLSPNTLKAMLRCKRDKAILVSDAVKFAGMPPGEYASVIGGDVILHENGRLSTKNNPAILAGSAHSIPNGIENAMKYADISLADAIDMVTRRPAMAMGLQSHGRLEAGSPGNITLFYYDLTEGKIQVVETVVEGKSVYKM